MAITKPFAVLPLPLGTITTGNERSNRPASHLGAFKDAGMVWQSNGNSTLWVRGDMGSPEQIDFMAMLSANAQAGTQYRLRLGNTQAAVDGSTLAGPITTGSYTASSNYTGYGAALTSNGAGLRDGGTASTAGTSHLTDGTTADGTITIDYGSATDIAEIKVADIAGSFGDQTGVVLEGSPDGSTWTAIGTLGAATAGTTRTFSAPGTWRYIRVRQPLIGFLSISEFYGVMGGFLYDSGTIPFISPAITRSDALYGSHLEMPSVIGARWWRLDISGHTGDFQASALVLGQKLTFSNFYNDKGFEFGQEDYGSIEIGRYGVLEELGGIKMRTLTMDFGWMTDSDRFTKFQPLRDSLGTTGVALWCFDPDATAQRQDKTYFGWLRKPVAYRASSFKQDRWAAQFDVLSMI